MHVCHTDAKDAHAWGGHDTIHATATHAGKHYCLSFHGDAIKYDKVDDAIKDHIHKNHPNAHAVFANGACPAGYGKAF